MGQCITNVVKIARHDNSQKTISTRLMLSYHEPSSVAFVKNLKKTFATLGSLNVNFTTSKLKSHLGGLKAVPKPLRSHLVYEISCSTCCGTYVGQTVRHLDTLTCYVNIETRSHQPANIFCNAVPALILKMFEF